MKKVSFEERKGIRKYILHDSTLIPVNIVKISDDGWTYQTDTGELLSAPSYNAKGEFFVEKIEGKFYKIEEDIGYCDDETKPWDESRKLYDLGKVVTLEGTEEEAKYMFDGWCNLYPRPNGEKGTISSDCHPSVKLIFT